jgi:nucleotide-binding universal stress UspA family protein
VQRARLRNVLVATDFTEPATRAVERATRLPLAPHATVTLLHVVPFIARADDPPAAPRALGHAVSCSAATLARIGRADVHVVPRVGHGMPYADIGWAAREGKHDLVVVGRHGQQRVRDLVLGTTTEHVVHSCEIPVLVVATHPIGPYARPLVAVDCSAGARCALELAGRLTDASLEVVHAYDPGLDGVLRRAALIGEAARRHHAEAKRRARRAVEAFLERHGFSRAHVVVREGMPRRAILDVAMQHDCDLLVVGARGRSGLAQLRLGSVSEAVLREATCDVLVARAEPAAPSRL